jgi:hypothetical protein
MRVAAHLLIPLHTAATVQGRSYCASQSSAAVRAAAGEVVSSVQRLVAGELVGDLGAFAGLPILLCPVACRLYPMIRQCHDVARLRSPKSDFPLTGSQLRRYERSLL